ncbi:MAG: trypsin-like peptidase domain-containing protein [Rhizobiaceae bacterium]|nr:trypsin-like peptidase domain-containing protein [Rhizobiaceae bacterium]
MHFIDQMIHTTTLIQTSGSGNGEKSATAFVFGFPIPTNPTHFIPTLISNRHVIQGSTDYHFKFTLTNPSSGEPQLGDIHRVNGQSNEWVMHPDNDVDLAMLPLSTRMTMSKENGKACYIKGFGPQDILNEKQLRELLLPVEEILMVGYPSGLIDDVNNLPIVRQGITATAVYNSYNGQNQFLTDCASFGGSSGSPIVWRDFSTKLGRSPFVSHDKRKHALLGVHFSGFGWKQGIGVHEMGETFHNQDTSVPTMPVNIGRCIRADEILKFETAALDANEIPPEPFRSEVEKLLGINFRVAE